MRKQVLLLISVILLYFNGFAQYADVGTGALKNQIWWFDWSGFNIYNGATKTFSTADGLSVTISFSKVSGDIPVPEVMNTWYGAVLHFLYDFSNPSIKPALYKVNTANNSNFSINVSATRKGVPVAFTFIAADAEASATTEYLRLKTNASAWKTIDFFRNSSQTSNPLQGCGTSYVSITDTYGQRSEIGQNPVVATEVTTQPLNVDITFERSRIYGGSGIAFGIFAPIDRGDLPSGFGYAQHSSTFSVTNSCNYLPPYPKLIQSQDLKIGLLAGDADGDESLDDNNSGADEDGLISFKAYNGSGSYGLSIPLTNTTGVDAFLNGWFDYNRDGVFNINEGVQATIPNGTTSTTLTWSNLPALLPTGSNIQYAFRFRLSTDALALKSPTGYAKDGEIEDYVVNLPPQCALTVTSIEDVAICSGESVRLTTQGADQYGWLPSSSLSSTSIADPIASPLETTMYIVTGTDNKGCIAKDTVIIHVKPKPTITKSQDQNLCRGDSAQLGASSTTAISYQWAPSIGLNNSAINNPLASPQTTTKYFITVSSSNGCNNIDSVTLTVFEKPTIRLNPDTSVCKKTSLTLSTESVGATSFNWSPTSGLFSTEAPTATALIMNPIQYIVTAIGAGNCYAKDSIFVDVLPSPIVDKSADTIICPQGIAQLRASGGTSYVWTPNVNLTSPTTASTFASPTSSTQYYVTVTDKNGCSAQDSVSITVEPKPSFDVQPAFPTVCLNTPVTITATGADVYSWLSENDVVFASTNFITIKPSTSTVYKVGFLYKVCNIRDTLLVPIQVNLPPQTSVSKSNDIDCSNAEAQLVASGGINYIWDKAEGVTDANSPITSIVTAKTTTYYVTVTDHNNCSKRDSVTVYVNFDLGKSLHHMPSAFTPNGDGKNDCFGLKHWGSINELFFNIYNRWGEKVFSTSNPNECWDGNFKGKQQQPGLFVYLINAQTACGNVSKKGTVMLLR